MKTTDLYNKRIIKVKNTSSNIRKKCYMYTKHRSRLGIEQHQLDLFSCFDDSLHSGDEENVKNVKHYFNHVHDDCPDKTDIGKIKLVPLKHTRDFYNQLKNELEEIEDDDDDDNKKEKKNLIFECFKTGKYRKIVGNNYSKIDKINKKVPVRFKNNFTYLDDV